MLVERASLVYNKIMQLVSLPRLTCALVAAMLFLSSLPGAAQAANCYGNTYTVSPGESLYSLTLQCGIPYAALLGINVEIPDPNTIRPGQVVRLVAGEPLYNNPTGGPAQVGGLQEDGDYIVRPGDSLARIAYLYRTNVPQLAQLNPQLGSRASCIPDSASTCRMAPACPRDGSVFPPSSPAVTKRSKCAWSIFQPMPSGCEPGRDERR
jgi:LysM repeat protein